MAAEHVIDGLVINKVESQSVYDNMLANNLVNDDEMYLIEDNNEYYNKTEADNRYLKISDTRKIFIGTTFPTGANVLSFFKIKE